MLLETSGAAPLNTAGLRNRSITQRLCSFPVVLGALLVMLTVLTVRSRFNDPDTWWHLKTGEIIWKTHSIPRVDLFSFTAAGHPWIAQEWLSELTIYGAYRLGGYSGLMLWLCLASSLLVIAGYLLSAIYSQNMKVAFIGGLLVWLFATVGFAIRPHVIGYLLLIGELLILHIGRTHNTRWFFALPPLFALWINFHSSFIFGFLVLGVVLVCSFMKFECALLVSKRENGRVCKMLTVAFGLSTAFLFINPIGPKLIWYPIAVMFKQRLNIASVAEWQPLPFSDIRVWALLGTAGFILLLPLVTQVRLRLTELVLIAIGFGLAVQHQRMLVLFGILTAPVLSRLLAQSWDHYQPAGDRVLPNAITLGLAAFAIMAGFPDAANLTQQLEKANPVKAVQFLEHSGLSGRMLNEYVYGGYLIWAASNRKVFIDGRADLFEPADVLAIYGRWALLQEDPRLLLNQYGIRICLLSRNHPMTYIMPLLVGWKLIYSDANSAIFARQS
jgi:putative Ca2+/H+ antiporter (TMEM165/GDT1 family)